MAQPQPQPRMLSGMERERIKATVACAFPEMKGPIGRGTLTKLYDERFGKYESRLDLFSSTVLSALVSDGDEDGAPMHRLGPWERPNLMLRRIDAIAQALFLNGHFERSEPQFEGFEVNAPEHRDPGAFVRILLEHAERRVRGLLVLDAGEQSDVRNQHNLLFVKRMDVETAFLLLRLAGPEPRMGLFEIDPFVAHAEVMQANWPVYPPEFEQNPNAGSYATVREAFEALCQRLEMSGIRLENA